MIVYLSWITVITVPLLLSLVNLLFCVTKSRYDMSAITAGSSSRLHTINAVLADFRALAAAITRYWKTVFPAFCSHNRYNQSGYDLRRGGRRERDLCQR